MRTVLFKRLPAVLLCLSLLFGLSACKKRSGADELWKAAVYTENTELGQGTKVLHLEVKAGDRSVQFTVHTDADTVGAALLENDLISGEEGDYGLYVKKVNGITADYDTDQSYWAFNINGEYAMTGVDGTVLSEEDSYQLVYSK